MDLLNLNSNLRIDLVDEDDFGATIICISTKNINT